MEEENVAGREVTMSLMFRVLFASACRSTHHKLAMDALRHIRGDKAVLWQQLFIKFHKDYLEGSKAPDTKFKDFRNHVLHVRENYWGGAVKAAREWYGKTLEEFRNKRWQQAVYSAGVLSHYYTDPIQPFHTGQSQAESNIHRAAEWSITKSYDEIRKITYRQQGLPSIECPNGDDWLDQMVVAGAELANPYYETLIEHYDFKRGKSNPPEGLDQTSREILARLIGHAQVGFARILEHVFVEADAAPPKVDLTIEGFMATVEVPIRWITKKMEDAEERQLVEAMYAEFQQTGKVDKTLSEDDRTIRDLHQQEVIEGQGIRSYESPLVQRHPVPPQPKVESTPKLPVVFPMQEETSEHTEAEDPFAEETSRFDVEESQLRFHLEPDSDVEDAPSIGPKTARRLAKVGIHTVSDLLAADPERTAPRLPVQYITADIIRDWQDQARLACQIPEIRGHDVQILVACDYRDVGTIAAEDPGDLLEMIDPFVNSSAGERIIRSGKKPDLNEVTDWIHWAGQARQLRAA